MKRSKGSKAIAVPVVDTPENPMHTVRRGATYYFRRKIPLDLVAAHGGKREATFSLKTKNRAEAERAARKASVRLDEEWTRMRCERVSGDVPLDYDLVEVGGKVVPVPPPPGGWPKPEPLKMTAAEHEQVEYEHQLETEENVRQEAHAEAEADRIIQAARLRGLQFVPAMAAEPARDSTTLEDLVAHWKRERKPTPKTVATCERAVLGFQNLHREPPVQRINRRMVVAFRDKLLEDGLAVGTVNAQLAYIGVLLGIAMDRGLVEANHAAGSALKEDKRTGEARRLPYTSTQALKVLTLTEKYRGTAPAKFWLPRLAKWTGARLNELHQLRREDLTERDGIRGLLITDAGENAPGVPMKLKNAGSRRWVPLHTEVAEFWDWTMEQPGGALFPARPNKFGIVSDAYSKAYGRMLRDAAGIKDKRITFHSWRHMFADKCRAAGVADSVRYALMGHAEQGAAGGYGSGELPPKVLAEALGKLGS